MSESEGREMDPITGYPKVEDSSPSEGAPREGAPPGSGDAAPSQQGSQDGPPPGSPRWNEVYRQMKENERRAAELERELAEARAGRPEDIFTPTQQPAPAATPQALEDDDPFAPLYEGIEQRVKRLLEQEVGPLRQTFAQQQQAAMLERQRSEVKRQFADYEPQRDDPVLAQVARRFGVNSVEAAYRLAFPERVAAAAQREMQQSQPPVPDVPGSSSQAPANSIEDLMREFQTTRDSRRKEEIASILSDRGAWGSARAEKALGLG